MIAAELRGGNKPSLNEALGWIGSRVDDIYGANVGCLEDVWIDPGSGVPKWLLVKEGRFGGRTTLIPFEDATAGAGHVWVPYEREIVRDAPEIEPGAPLTHQVEASLRSHYAANAPAAISHRGQSVGQGDPLQPVAPRAEMRQPPEPQRQPQRERPRLQPESPPAPRAAPQHEAGLPPVQLPARPAPPIAAPTGYEDPPARPEATPPHGARPQRDPYQQPPAWEPDPYPQPPAWQPDPYAQPQPDPYAQPPAQQPSGAYLPPPVPEAPLHPAYEQVQPAQAPPAQPQPQPPAGAPALPYVEIELGGGLTIRGELHSLRIVPRD